MIHQSKNNVLEAIVANDLCIGCGLCAATCPHNTLRIEFNEVGENVACKQGDKCPDSCNICLRVCPFSDQCENEDVLGAKLFADTLGIKHLPEMGYYLDTFVGHSLVDDHRMQAASGGLTTWALEQLIEMDLIDYAVCVSATGDSDKLFKFKVCSTIQEIRNCSRSCYYPVEISEAVRYILANDGRYAIVGLPCMCKAIRSAMQLNPKLQLRVKFVLGLTCGQTKSKFFAEYVCALGGGDPEHLEEFIFRVKGPDRPASNFGMKFVCQADNKTSQEGVVFRSDGVNSIWDNRCFTPNACDFCDDVFAELADACFLDAWLPAYFSDWKGNNMVLLRQKELLSIFQDAAADGLIELKNLAVRDVISSQKGVFQSKRCDIKERVSLAKRQGRVVPEKRLSICNFGLTFGRKRLVYTQHMLARKSGQEWNEANKKLSIFITKLGPYFKYLQRAAIISRLRRIPSGLIRRLKAHCGSVKYSK